MSVSVQNMEEAATIASEFVSSLDNLPSEVQHLLQEIKHKESRSQDIQQEIAKETAKYIRHSLRVPSPSGTGSPRSTPVPNPKSHLPPKIATSYTEIERLHDEKRELAQRIVDLVARTKARLEADLVKVGVLQGEIVEGMKSGVGTPVSVEGHLRSPVVQMTDSLRSALNGTGGEGIAVTPISNGGPSAQKKRRLTTQNSIKLPSPVPPPGYARSRLSRQIHLVRGGDEEGEGEGEGEEDGEGEEGDEGEGEDKGIYCFCQKQSFGEMIACDNKDCPYQWFHLSCVNLKQPLPDSWYCSNECRVKGGIRKGRKK